MIEKFESILTALIGPACGSLPFLGIDPVGQIDEKRLDHAGMACSMNAAFIIVLCGAGHPEYQRAERYLQSMAALKQWDKAGRFYIDGIDAVKREIEAACLHEKAFKEKLAALSDWVSKKENLKDKNETQEKIWSVFFPEGVGIRGGERKMISSLRSKREVVISQLNRDPVSDPAGEILFTSNVMLTVPYSGFSPEETGLGNDLADRITGLINEPQLYWYDHPVIIGVRPEENEVLYGLRGLSEALKFEVGRGRAAAGAKLNLVLSVSVTHKGLHDIAKEYLEGEFERFGYPDNLSVYIFTDKEAEKIIDDILVPAAERLLNHENAGELLGVFGINGEYGRHYSFLKAISAFWKVFIHPETLATFKIDLDQVFPQKELVEQTGSSAFEHLTTPLWGAEGLDNMNRPLDLGMIAGALVNESDIAESLFIPDVHFPVDVSVPDEYIFFSRLPQALSTEAEMMARYGSEKLDGIKRCIQRIHVTGGTNGILVDSLRRHRPFTPSFIGRAEDQAFILTSFSNHGPRLAYVHKDGLIMRHDKNLFAGESIRAAHTGKIIGDYVRLLLFSVCSRIMNVDICSLKDIADPFTGCFISRIPLTTVYLAFALKATEFFRSGNYDRGLEFITQGTERISRTMEFISGEESMLKRQYEKERLGWDLYYDILSAVERALESGDEFAAGLVEKAKDYIMGCLLNGEKNRT